MEVEAMRRMVKKLEHDHNVAVGVTDHDSKMAKVIRESGWDVRPEYNANHTKEHWTAIAKNFQNRSNS
jgi:hypothetical protein